MSRKTPEGRFKDEVLDELDALLPGCFILWGNSRMRQGVPDILVLWGGRWGMLEVKASANSKKQPNQDYYVDLFDEMSFAAFIYPENKEEVLSALQSALCATREARLS